MADSLIQDLRHGLRMLVKNPGFALVAVLSIAIGVGANAAMFSIADGLILRPFPVPSANELLTIAATTPSGETRINETSYPDYTDIRDRAHSFEGLAATNSLMGSLARQGDESARGTYAQAVSANFFDVLHVRPAMGRTFLPEEDRVAGRDAVVILSHETWTEQFGADPEIVGREIRISGRAFTVVGVAPEGFTGIDMYLSPAFYVPLAMLTTLNQQTRAGFFDERDARSLRVVGRLAQGASIEQASQEIERIGGDLQREHPDTNERRGLRIRTAMQTRLDQFAPVASLSAILIGLAVAVLLVACANVAGLLTSRAPVRAREIALRLAIGGSRRRLVRQLITESFLIALAGGLAGLVLAYAIVGSFQQFQVVTDIGVRIVYKLDERALLVALVIAAVAAVLSSVVPAWRTTRAGDLSGTLRNTAAPSGRTARLWGRHGLVAVQIALTLVLLTVALSFYRAFQAEYGRGPGFRTDHIVLAGLDPALARYDQRQSDDFYRLVKDRVAASTGVTSVAVTSFVPLSQDGGERIAVVPEGFTLPPGVDSVPIAAARIDEHYFDAIGIALESGRAFQLTDTENAPLVAIVSRGMATRYWPGENPIGKRIRLVETASARPAFSSQSQPASQSGPAWAEVVGVAADAKFRLFTSVSTPFLYVPRLQHPSTRNTLVVRTDIDSFSAATQVRLTIQNTDRNVPILGMRTMETFYFSNSKNLNTVVVRTIAGMGTMGLLLALAGLYGLMAYAVGRRTREIGIRMAVGALPVSVLRMILRQGLLPSVAGIGLGVLASFLTGNATQALFPGTAVDRFTYLSIVPIVIAVVMLAAYIPARRAARIDPLLALRHD